MGRARNIERAEARAAGLRFYTTPTACDACFDDQRYVSNAMCVTCTINAGKDRYQNLDDAGRERQRQRDHARYLRRARQQGRPPITQAIVGEDDFV